MGGFGRRHVVKVQDLGVVTGIEHFFVIHFLVAKIFRSFDFQIGFNPSARLPSL